MRSLFPAALLAVTLPVLMSAFSSPSVSTTHVSRFAFEKNQGQTDAAVEYLTRTATGVVFFTKNGLVLNGSRAGDHESRPLRFEFIGANANATWAASESLPDRVSYHVGSDPKRWAEDVERFSRLTRKEAYPGIDITYYGSDGQLEYDFVLAPGAHPDQIRFRLSGTEHAKVSATGNLEIRTSTGLIIKRLPAIYQIASDGSRQKVDGHLRQDRNGDFGFALGAYDATRTLYIDPVLEAASYLGGSGDEKLVYFDAKLGLMAGTTTSVDFPGAEPARRAGTDVFVRVLSPATGAPALFVFGGSGDEEVTAAAAGSQWFLITGTTSSTDLADAAMRPWAYSARVWDSTKKSDQVSGFALAVPASASFRDSLFTYLSGEGEVKPTACWVSRSGWDFAIAGTTTSNDLLPGFSFGTPRREISGGRDGFLLYSPSVWSSPQVSFFGGSSDDIPKGVVGTMVKGLPYYVVAGETSSADYPVLDSPIGSRQGETDAFVTGFVMRSGALDMGFSTLYGGSGSDSANTLVAPGDGSLWIGGRSNSTDFPVLKPWQSGYGGGVSDAFIVQLGGGLDVLFSTLYGGSGDDEITASAADETGGLYFGGNTTSTDLKTQNAAQERHGGGWDGMLLQVLSDGSLYQASYFGGSGDDKVLNVLAPAAGLAQLTGTTTSSNLDTVPAKNSSLSGASDGFQAQIRSLVAQAQPVHGGKDLRMLVTLKLSGIGGPDYPSVKLTSSDPSLVVVAPNQDVRGTSSLEAIPSVKGELNFFGGCLAASGTTTIRVQVPGYTAAGIPVYCHPSKLMLSAYPSSRLVPGSNDNQIVLAFVAVDEVTKLYHYGTSRGDVSELIVSFRSTNPEVGVPDPSSLDAKGTVSWGGRFLARQRGETILTAVAQNSDIAPSDPVPVSVGATISSQERMVFLHGWQSMVNWSAGDINGPVSAPGMVTSDNGEVLALSRDPRVSGSNRISSPSGPGRSESFYVQALQTGAGPTVFFDVEGLPQRRAETSVVDGAVYLSAQGGQRKLEISLGSTASLGLALASPNSSPTYFAIVSPNPQTGTLHFRVQSADESIVASTEADWEPGGNWPTFSLKPLKAGQTTVKLIPPDGLPIDSAHGDTLTVIVNHPKAGMKNIEVGKDLSATMTVTFGLPLDGDTTLKVRIDRPELALLAPLQVDTASQELEIPVQKGLSSASFRVYGLASSGEATVTASMPSLDGLSAKVSLDPSTIGWSSSSGLSTSYQASYPLNLLVAAYATDAASGLPVLQQVLRPGVSRWVTAELQGARIGHFTEATREVTSDPNNNSFQLYIDQPGSTEVTLSGAAGTVVAGARRVLPITIAKATMGTVSATIGMDLQTGLPIPYNLNTSKPEGLMVTVTSLDPSKVIVATDSTKVGSASITVRNDQLYRVVLQALTGTGTAQVRVSARNYEDGLINVAFVPVSVQANVASSGIESRSDGLYTTTLSPKSTIKIEFFPTGSWGGVRRAGAAPLTVQVASSNPDVATISPSSVSFQSGGQNSALVTFTPTGKPGATTITISGPEGVKLLPANGLPIRVEAPRVSVPNYTLGKDLVTPLSVSLPQTLDGLQEPVPIKVETLDPNRVLLSLSPTDPGVANVTILLGEAKGRWGRVYAHALSDDGTVSVRTSASGFEPVLSQMQMVRPVLLSYLSPGVAISLESGGSPSTPQVFIRSEAPSSGSGFTSAEPAAVRKGVQMRVEVASSDTNVVTATPQILVFDGTNLYRTLSLKPVNPGDATVTLSPPPGLTIAAALSTIPVSVTAPKINLQWDLTLGQDFARMVSLSSSNYAPISATIFVESEDPERVLVSTDCSTPGQTTIQVVAPSGQSPTFCIQSLAGTGTATVRMTAKGYQPAEQTVNLRPVTAYFDRVTTAMVAGQDASGRVLLGIATAWGGVDFGSGTLRPGVSPTIEVTSSNPDILQVKQSPLTFDSTGAASFIIRGISAGTAKVRVSAPSNGQLPPDGYREATVTVVAAQP